MVRRIVKTIETMIVLTMITITRMGGFSKSNPLKLYKKASFCHKKAQFQIAVTSACLLQNRCAFLPKTGNRKIFLSNG